uniref:Uncharacterized protein n=1 Tax=Ciona savignyi TaxID=51511 RepID=H2Y946_CIOSA
MVEEKLLSHEKEIIENQVDKPVEPKKSVNIFGAAKPVDTSAREREMEGKIAEQEKLILQKVQTKPPTPTHTPSQASIFGNAKPVDTTAREREIEEKIRMQERDLIPDSSHPRNIRYQRSDRSDDGVTSPRRRSRTSSTRSEDAVEPHPSPNEAKKPQYKPAPAPKQSAWGGRDPSASHIRGTSAREEAKGKCKEKVVGRTPEGAEDNEIQASGNQPRYQSARNQLPREQTKKPAAPKIIRHRAGDGRNQPERRHGDGDHMKRGGQRVNPSRSKKRDGPHAKRDSSWDSNPECDQDSTEEAKKKEGTTPPTMQKEERVDFVVKSKFALLAVDSGERRIEME